MQMHHMEKQVQKWSLIANNDGLRFGGEKIARVVELIARHAADFHRVAVGPVGRILALKDCKCALKTHHILTKKRDFGSQRLQVRTRNPSHSH
jgi:hypothetical protein